MVGSMEKANTRGTGGNFLIVALAVLPIFVIPSRSLGAESVFLLPKLYWLAFVLVPASIVAATRSGIRWRSIVLPTALVGWMFAASMAHPTISTSLLGRAERLDGAVSHLGLLLCAIGGVALLTLGRRASLVRALAISGTLVAVIVIAQRFGLGNLANAERSIILADMPGATIGNRGYAACVLAGLLPLALTQACRPATSRPDPRWIAAALAMGVAVGFGWTRGASVAALGGIAAFVACSSGARKNAAFVGLIAAAGVIVGTLTSQSALRAGSSEGVHAFSAADSGRKPLYAASFWGIRQQPFVGLGAGGVLRALNSAPPKTVLTWAGLPTINARRSPEATNERLVLLSEDNEGRPVRYDNITTKAHNELLDYAVSYGVPAAVLAALTLGLALWRSRSDPAVFGALTAFSLGLLTWPQVMRTAPVIWAILGVALATSAAHAA